MFTIIEAKPLANYRVWLRFADGTAGEVDLSHLAGQGVFRRWDAPGAFVQLSIGPSGGLTWGDEVELCPDALYLKLTGKTPDQVFPQAVIETPSHA